MPRAGTSPRHVPITDASGSDLSHAAGAFGELLLHAASAAATNANLIIAATLHRVRNGRNTKLLGEQPRRTSGTV